jgi:predicted RecA/RadA family phage recombinase
MATNFKQPGDCVSYTLGSGETSTVNRPIWVGNIQGIADRTGVAGDAINILRCGIFEAIPKTTGTAWTVGQAIYWDAANSKGITTDETGKLLGYAAVAATSGATTGDIILLEEPRLRHVSYAQKTITAGTTSAVADTRITATSHISVSWLTNTTASGTFLVALDPGVGYTITVRKPADATLENTAAGTVSVKIEY